ncbi:hypothetical protein IFT90_00065 [Frigoribacterium sp. CFBP 8766]|uniref:DUF6049 family protein n=1 Tax=Frigoribacterium sp. CFBP 8766 TaxID=2775273 RepID=UPI001784C41A|nr:DUF6049 family protein [Frigoribacterium sp. CFBP 8766]MBD8582950.1 hypothetical protein [Frigoribacterium sp. CFBP 8766]
MRRLHALLAALTAVFVVVVGLGLGSSGSSPARAAAAASSAPDDAVTLSLAPAESGVLVPDRDLVLDVVVTNATEDDLAASVARIYLDRQAFVTRAKLAGWLSPASTSGSDYLGTSLTRVDVPEVPSGQSRTVGSVTVPAATVALGGYGWGARALGARLVDDDGAQLAQARSSVSWFPAESFQATKVAVAVPITTPETENGVLDASALSAYTSIDGTLTRQLRAVQGTQAAVAVDPMIIASVRLLGTSAPPSALDWLDQLLRSGLEMFPLAYADADVAGLSQGGATPIPTPVSFDALIDPTLFAEPTPSGTPEPSSSGTSDPSAVEPPAEGSTGGTGTDGTGGTGTGGTGTGQADDPSAAPPLPTTESLLSWPWSTTGVAWPEADTVVAADLDVLAASGYTSTILSSSNVEVSTGATENAATQLGATAGLVSDDTLSTLLSEAAGASDDAAWATAMAELSASVATVARERPSDARTLLATLGRGWSPDSAYLTRTLAALRDLPWSAESTLQEAVASAPTAATVVDEPEDDARAALMRTLATADRRVSDFSTALAQPQTVTAPSRLRTLALASHSWRANPDGLAAEVADADAESVATSGLVSIVQGSDLSILGDRTSLPLYVQNSTSSAATVYLMVQPSNSLLSVEENRIEVTVASDSQARVRVPVQSVANGTVDVSLSLVSATGVAISTPSTVSISVQAGWETAITWVFAVGFLVLFGGGIYRTFRKRRLAREEAAAGTSAGADGAAGAAGSDTTETGVRPDTTETGVTS